MTFKSPLENHWCKNYEKYEKEMEITNKKNKYD